MIDQGHLEWVGTQFGAHQRECVGRRIHTNGFHDEPTQLSGEPGQQFVPNGHLLIIAVYPSPRLVRHDFPAQEQVTWRRPPFAALLYHPCRDR